MFTGIIETLGEIKSVAETGSNRDFIISPAKDIDLHVDQSLSHNGVCLTVTAVGEKDYQVTAVEETLSKSNLGLLSQGDIVNLERCMPSNGRFDGHIVQGHVDQTGTCIKIEERHGSWLFHFEYDPKLGNVTVEKGSICVNGVSLTCFNAVRGAFTVTIIPYTFEHTNFKTLTEGDSVNLEFDIIGKYVQALIGSYKTN